MEKLIVGVDLQTEYTEYSYWDEEKQDALSVSDSKEQESTQYKNALFYSTKENKWYFGADAQEQYMTQAGQYFEDIIKKLSAPASMVIEGQEYDYKDLFCIMIRSQLEHCFGADLPKLSKMIITSPLADEQMVKLMDRLAKTLGLKNDQIELVSPNIATLFYVFHQDSGIWTNGVAIFQYDEEGMKLQRIGVQRYQRPMRITITNEILERMPESSASNEEKDKEFTAICRSLFVGRNRGASGVYLLGDGFKENWIEQSAQVLCQGRRAFVGQNIHAKGACIAAQSGSAAISQDGSVFVETPGMIHYDIGVKVNYHGEEQIAPIALGEREWFNVDGKATIFLDGTNRIEIVMYHQASREMTKEVIEIKGLPKRPPKTTKLEIRVRYLDAHRGEICIRDKGFGTMYPTTGKVYRKEFILPEE